MQTNQPLVTIVIVFIVSLLQTAEAMCWFSSQDKICLITKQDYPFGIGEAWMWYITLCTFISWAVSFLLTSMGPSSDNSTPWLLGRDLRPPLSKGSFEAICDVVQAMQMEASVFLSAPSCNRTKGWWNYHSQSCLMTVKCRHRLLFRKLVTQIELMPITH